MFDIHQNGPQSTTFIYAVSSFFYAFAGLIRLYQNFHLDAFNLIIQSFLSFISDVITLSIDSIWHPIDRLFAIYTCFYHFSTITSPISFITQLIIFLIGYNFLNDSNNFYDKNDDSFEYYHTLWHMTCIIMLIVDLLIIKLG